MKQYNWEQDQIAHMKVNYCKSRIHRNNAFFFYKKKKILIFRIILHVLVMEVQNLLDKPRVKKKH